MRIAGCVGRTERRAPDRRHGVVQSVRLLVHSATDVLHNDGQLYNEQCSLLVLVIIYLVPREANTMNGEVESEQHTIRVAAPSVEKQPLVNNNNNSEYSKYRPSNMPQRSPFAIQELLGLSEPSGANLHRSPTAGVSAITPQGHPGYFPHPHMVAVNASRMGMAYFNAQAAVAAFFPHNMNSIAAAMSPGPAPPSSAVLAHNNSHGKSRQYTIICVKM
ncbi:hypothetical protein J6590_000103 [Homalodisca vitripennis]|nr:hypothetical protein J6590_000103 [Homalodisca vitripennis]